MSRTFRSGIIAFALLGVFSASRSARAWPYYFEFGGTTASLTDPAPLFQSLGKTASTSATSSFGIPATLGIHLQQSQRGLLISLAVQARYLTGNSGAGESYSVMPTSPMLRVEFWRFVLGAGYTPWVWNDLTFRKNGAIDSVITFEGQFLLPITPEIDFGLQAARTTYSSSLYGDGPTVLEYGAFFRLNFGLSDAALGERKKFKGWRYPFGSPLR